MYVPPFEALLRRLNTTKSGLENTEDVAVPVGLLKLLLQMANACADFDEEKYLSKNPDVRDAVKRGAIESGRLHYIGFGYFEGRGGGTALVDEAWYLRKYPDVANAVKEGRVQSATDHFNSIGAAEGRSPNAEQQESALQWKDALHGKQMA